MTHFVTAIVQNNIGYSNFIEYSLQKLMVLLLADKHFDLVLFEFLAFRVDVDPYDSGMGAKIALPHLQRSAQSAADFDEGDRLVHELFEVAFINWEVVLPFMNDPLVVIEEIGPKSHLLCCPARWVCTCTQHQRFKNFISANTNSITSVTDGQAAVPRAKDRTDAPDQHHWSAKRLCR